jgi:hypothetical protein
MIYRVKKEFEIKTKSAKFKIQSFLRVGYDGHYLTIHPLTSTVNLKYLHGDKLRITLIEWNKIKQNLK